MKTDQNKTRKGRQKELEALAKSHPEEVERLFTTYYPNIAVPEVGGVMIQSIIAHEMEMEPTLFQG